MKVILRQAVPKLGKEGQVVNVKGGYARNFLFPQGMAVVADKSQMKVLERRNARVSAHLAETKAAAEKVKATLDGKTVRLEGRVGKDAGKLFGAITAQDVADAIKAQFGVALEKKAVVMVQAIKRLGNFPTEIDVHRNVDIRMNVQVFDPAAPEDVAVQAEEAAEVLAGAEIAGDVEEEA